MKKILPVLFTLVMSSICSAAAAVPVGLTLVECEHCATSVSADSEKGQGINGYKRQVQRGLEPAMENARPALPK